jgi:hypothetical protein
LLEPDQVFRRQEGNPHLVDLQVAQSRAAIAALTDILSRRPDDLSARWLLNVAYMTLGEYPDQVPSAWLIPPSAFASEYPLPNFPNIAGKLGLDQEGLGRRRDRRGFRQRRRFGPDGLRMGA